MSYNGGEFGGQELDGDTAVAGHFKGFRELELHTDCEYVPALSLDV